MGYGVLPFALEQQCQIVFLIGGDVIELAHMDNTQFPSVTLPLSPDANPEFLNNYAKYFWAGYQAGIINKDKLVGCKMLITGNVPLSSGLSSSSSLVVASALVAVALQGIDNPDLDSLITRIIHYERLAGTACGGMDQTISLFGKLGKALYIEFGPIRYSEVQLPIGYTFVIANSMTPSTKLETLGQRYNKRVSECRVGIKIIEKSLNLDTNYTQLLDLQLHLKETHDGMLKYIDMIPKGEILLEKLEYLDLPKLLGDIHSYEIVLNSNKSFNPHNRLLHVIQEAARVIEFKNVCNQEISNEDKAIQLGRLMDDSQISCRSLYECSSDNIDRLTMLSKQCGALGSRLTGAGWGGGTVSLVKSEQAQTLITEVCQQFYNGVLDNNVIFVSQPSSGASVSKL